MRIVILFESDGLRQYMNTYERNTHTQRISAHHRASQRTATPFQPDLLPPVLLSIGGMRFIHRAPQHRAPHRDTTHHIALHRNATHFPGLFPPAPRCLWDEIRPRLPAPPRTATRRHAPHRNAISCRHFILGFRDEIDHPPRAAALRRATHLCSTQRVPFPTSVRGSRDGNHPRLTAALLNTPRLSVWHHSATQRRSPADIAKRRFRDGTVHPLRAASHRPASLRIASQRNAISPRSFRTASSG